MKILVFVSFIVFAIEAMAAKAPPLEIDKLASIRAESLLVRFTELAVRATPALSSRISFQHIAYDIFYIYEMNSSAGASTATPQISKQELIWVKLKKNPENSQFLELVSEVLSPLPQTRKHLSYSNYSHIQKGPELAINMSLDLRGKNVVVFEDFPKIYRHISLARESILPLIKMNTATMRSTILVLDDENLYESLDSETQKLIGIVATGGHSLLAIKCRAEMN